MIRMRDLCLACLTLLASVLPAAATTIVLDMSGVLGPTSTLGGAVLGANTPFTLEATFDSTTDSSAVDGLGLFDTVVIFSIHGHGTFTSDPAGNVSVYLDNAGGNFSVGLATSTASSGFLQTYSTATPPFDADAPIPSVLTGPFLPAFFNFPFTIPLSGGAGNLVFNVDSGLNLGGDATLNSAVPEPATLTLFGLGTLGLARSWRRRRREG